MRKRPIRINERIRVPNVRLIDENGAQLGVMPTREALGIARDRGYDLVEVAADSNPPVCRIMDYGKYQYEMSKKERAARKKSHSGQLKEIKFRPKTDEHDYQFKMRHILDFLQNGHKVKIMVEFRGREMTHLERGHMIMDRVQEELKDIANFDTSKKMEGRILSLIVAPRSKP